MSQFSTSYHLLTSNQQDAVKLLKSANLHGYVFPEKNGIVTFVIKQEQMSEFSCCEQLLMHNTKPLVFFINAEDHGWSYEIYDKNEYIAGYSSSFNEAEIMEGFDYNNPELFVPREDINYYIYEGSFQLERAKELLKDSIGFEKKAAIIQKSKVIVDSQKGMSKELTLSLKEEALDVYEFVKEFGIFFYEWVSYHYLEMGLEKDYIFDYGSFGKFPLFVV
ncbi:MAG: hypothetical protein ACRDBO_20010 [Lachnospiraceae bacterium]